MVSNETYVGDKRLQKKAPLDYLTKKPNPNQKVESNYLWDDHEAIIAETKRVLGIQSYRKMRQWYWTLRE